MYRVNIENIVASYFNINSRKRMISFKDLSFFKSNIEKRFKRYRKFVYIDYTKDSLMYLNELSNIFYADFKKQKVYFIKNKYSYQVKKIEDYYNVYIDSKILDTYLKISKSVNTKFFNE